MGTETLPIGLCSALEYSAILKELEQRGFHCNLLVFGAGKDSAFWQDVNKGRTLILENEKKWYDLTRSQGVDCLMFWDYKTMDHNQLPDLNWDVVFIDAPLGKKYGRNESYLIASQIKGAVILAHDYDREADRALFTKYFGNPDRIIDRLAIKYAS
jgi:hypothetical protein